MKCSRTYILTSVSLAVALLASSAMAAPRGSYKFNSSAMKSAKSMSTMKANRSAFSSKASRNLAKQTSGGDTGAQPGV